MNPITKDLEKFRERQTIFMTLLWVFSASAIMWTYNKEPTYALLSSVVASTCAYGMTYYSNKTNGITRDLILDTQAQWSGGDNFCFINFWQEGGDSLQLELYGGEKYSLSNVHITILDRSLSPNPGDVERYPGRRWPLIQTTQLPIIAECFPNTLTPIGHLTQLDVAQQKFSIYFTARNGSWYESYETILRPNNTYHKVIKVYKGKHAGGKLLKEYDSDIHGLQY